MLRQVDDAIDLGRLSVRTADGRPIAEFTGYSRTLGGPVISA